MINIENVHWSQDLPLSEWTSKWGTPLYIYDASTLRQQCQKLRKAWGEQVEILYAVKANANPYLLKLLYKEQLVDGLDIASSGELTLALESGWTGQQLSYTGPAKSKEQIQLAIDNKVTLCVESLRELEYIIHIARNLPTNVHPKIMLRINMSNPVHAFGLKTSGVPSPFGVDQEELSLAISILKEHLHLLDWKGIHTHAGSQCFSAKAFARGFQNVFEVVSSFLEADIPIPTVNLGGGFGIATWKHQRPLSIRGMVQHLKRMYFNSGQTCTFRIEPGRFIIAPAGMYITRVVGLKESRGEHFVLLDGGMNHLYEATYAAQHYPKKQHHILQITQSEQELISANLCGPLCTPRDRLGNDIQMNKPAIGDLIGWPNTGGYGWSASPFLFLGHQTPCELLHDNGQVQVIRPSMSLSYFSPMS